MVAVIRYSDVALQGSMVINDVTTSDPRDKQLTKVLSAAGFALQMLSYLGEFSGASKANLSYVKGTELLVRTCAAINKAHVEEARMYAEQGSTWSFCKGIAPDFCAVLRSYHEFEIYRLQHRVENSPPSPDSKYILPQCKQRLESHQQKLPIIQFAEFCLRYRNKVEREQANRLETLRDQYQRYINHIQMNNARANADAMRHNVQNDAVEIDPFNLVQQREIPAFLEDDIIFSRYMCPIGDRPIRDPVGDPTTQNDQGMTVYERSAIVEWLNNNPISPSTRQPLAIQQLVELPLVRVLIVQRLNTYSMALREAARSVFQVPADPQAVQAARNENPRPWIE